MTDTDQAATQRDLIDGMLRIASQRDLIGSAEVTDLLLDLRALIADDREA